MNNVQLDRYRRMLREIADRTARTAASLEEQVRTPTGGESAGGLSNAPLHLGDVGSEAYNQELGATLMENEAYIRDEAMLALGRIERGTFGRCENCGTLIPEERLDVLPYVRFCAPCATQLQSGRAVNLNDGRPPSWLGEPGHEGLNQTGTPDRAVGRDVGRGSKDVHATGTPGGGSAVGGLAGTNVGTGSPSGANLEAAMGSSDYDTTTKANDEEEQPEAFAGPSGGALGGTPANKRSRGGQSGESRTSGVNGRAKPQKPKTERARKEHPETKSPPKATKKSSGKKPKK